MVRRLLYIALVNDDSFAFVNGQLLDLQANSEIGGRNSKMQKELLSIPEAAEILSCSTRTVRRLIEERTIEACKLRSSTRVVYTSLRKYVLTLIADYQEEYGLAEYKSSN